MEKNEKLYLTYAGNAIGEVTEVSIGVKTLQRWLPPAFEEWRDTLCETTAHQEQLLGYNRD